MRFLVVLAVGLFSPLAASAAEIGFIEDFALARERSIPLQQLIPGTDDYYYYHALHYLNTERFEEARKLLAPWMQRHQRTPRVQEIEARLTLLTFEQNPQETLAWLRRELQLQFHHQKEVVGAEPNLPTALDGQLISRDTLLARAYARVPDLAGVEDRALDWLIHQPLTPERRRHLLQRLSRPDHEKLVELIVADLNHEPTPAFGAYPIHRQLLLPQLDELRDRKPELLNQDAYVQAYIAKLQPHPDQDWQHDAAIREAYLERLWAFVSQLAPAHNSLKVHVLYQRLVHDRAQGVYDKQRFLEYLKLPRPLPYVPRPFLERVEHRGYVADLNADFRGFTLLPPVLSDEPLVRSYLQHFFRESGDYKEFLPYVDDTYLRHLFAETKIVLGLGNPEQWANLLPPELYRQLKERVELEFLPTNRTDFAPGEPVQLELDIKNVTTLIVKVFEINTRNYYTEHGQEVNADINLDGLVANEEQTHTYKDSPFLRVRRQFTFPRLSQPGVYVVDFIGNGRSSRAVIRKGRLQHVVQTTPAGQAFRVFDESGEAVKDATIWLAGHQYSADPQGNIIVPFSNQPGRQAIVIRRGDFATLDYFQHEAENYTLTAGIYVDRESLLTRRKAQVVIRPGLLLNDNLMPPKLLEESRLTILSTDHDGITSSQEIRDLDLTLERETVREFQVPPRLASLQFILRAKVSRLSQGGQKVDLEVQETFALNEVEKTDKIETLHLVKTEHGYHLELLGRSGEVQPSRAVQLTLKHRDFQEPVHVALKTDARGRVTLGPLSEIDHFSATGPENTTRSWALRPDSYTYPQTVHQLASQAVELPYLGPADEPQREELSLLELRGETFAQDRFASLSIEGGLLKLDQLPAGDYDLLLKRSGTRIRLRLVEGSEQGRYVLGEKRIAETEPLPPPQIAQLAADDQQLRIQLANASELVRVHVFATRYEPAYGVFGHLSRVRDAEPFMFYPPRAESIYVTGRNIGDEYRYIIDRKYAPKFPGNMLDRPSLLLNPWAVRSTETETQLAQAGDEFAAAAPPTPGMVERAAEAQQKIAPTGDFAQLDFLAQASAVLLNLTPNEQGEITIPRDALGAHQYLHVVAVDPVHTTYRSLALPERPTVLLDLRLAGGLDPRSHYIQQKLISIVEPGKTFAIEDLTTSRFEIFDSLARVYALQATLSQNATLLQFGFLTRWPQLKPEEKRAKYSEFACHELNVFLFHKDPEFFQEVIRPYLAHKKDKTFVDQWLLQQDLEPYTRPWRHNRLNVVERILLGHQHEPAREHERRHVTELYELLPPNVDEFIRLFDTAVMGSALDAGDRFGVADAMADMREEKLMLGAIAADPAPQDAAEPQAMGLAGGPGRSRMGRAANGEQREMLRRSLAAGELAKQQLAELEADKRAAGKRPAQDRANAMHDNLYFALPMRGEVRQLYRKLDPTKEWAENNYYHLPIEQQNAQLITVNALWRDYAQHDPQQPFQSRHVAEAHRSFAEMMLALAALDLPFESPQHEQTLEGRRILLTAAGPMIVFHEELREARPAEDSIPVLVSQNFYRQNDRVMIQDNEQVDKFVSEEFLVDTVYGCRVVVTNPTSSRQKLNVLVQIPVGSIPVLNSHVTRTVHLSLEPYHTQTVEYYFYFPEPGEYAHYPVHVSKNEDLITSAEPFRFRVLERPSRVDEESWAHVSQHGTDEQVLNFLRTANVQRLELAKIAFRMQDAEFFESVTTLLRERRAFEPTLWSYALLHGSVPQIGEYLKHRDDFVNRVAGPLESPLLVIEPVVRHSYQHLEYKPLVNARAHALGQRRQIVNDRFHEQYHRFLHQLSYHRTLTDEDLLAVTYYLLLQDRVEDALATFSQVHREALATQLQYDYCAAYLSFYREDLAAARSIAARYAEYPVDRWRKTFAAVLAQLDEAEGKGTQTIDSEDRTQQVTQLAATEPTVEFQLEGKELVLNYQNLTSVRLNYYLMDVELLFSRNPFVQEFGRQFAAIRPHKSAEVELPADHATVRLPLPEELANRNVLIEVVGAGGAKTQAYYSNVLAAKVIESYGQVRVTHQVTGQPVSKAYVKVYARLSDGQVRFYKDGYTDIRGRFEYASLSTNELEQAARFSILVLSDEYGAVVREAQPPGQ